MNMDGFGLKPPMAGGICVIKIACTYKRVEDWKEGGQADTNVCRMQSTGQVTDSKRLWNGQTDRDGKESVFTRLTKSSG